MLDNEDYAEDTALLPAAVLLPIQRTEDFHLGLGSLFPEHSVQEAGDTTQPLSGSLAPQRRNDRTDEELIPSHLPACRDEIMGSP